MTETDPAFEALLEYLFQSHGFDFSGYKRSTLVRRVGKRMDELHLDGASQYLDYLQVRPEEFAVLFDTILINVTAFFRDPAAWDFLRETVIPRILAGKSDDDLIRVWSAGCASGEEAYTLAMVFAEALGMEAFRRRVKIYATDVDEAALVRARNGAYAVKELEGIPEPLAAKYFAIRGPRASFRADLRRSVIFGRHDLVPDAPIARLDLLVSRNTLMYFTAETQKRILAQMHHALADNGFLFLGRAEMLLTHTDLFAPLDLRHRIFTKVPHPNTRERLLALAPDRGDAIVSYDREFRLRDLVLDAGAVAQITVDAGGTVVLVNAAAREMFRLSRIDVGRRLQDLEISFHPVDLRSPIDQAQHDRHPARISEIERHVDEGHLQYLEALVTPLFDEDSSYIGSTVAFVDITSAQALRSELQRSKQELETAYEELQSTNQELESTNEELQSTVEELETTNEELHSANEELETMNEELQAANSELQSINAEMQDRSVELDRLNAFMESVLTSLRAVVVVVDTAMRVQTWNTRAQELWGLRSEEVVGRSLLTLDIGLPVQEFAVALRRCVTGETEGEERVVSARNRRGRALLCRVTFSPLLEHGVRRGAVVLMEETGARAGAPD